MSLSIHLFRPLPPITEQLKTTTPVKLTNTYQFCMKKKKSVKKAGTTADAPVSTPNSQTQRQRRTRRSPRTNIEPPGVLTYGLEEVTNGSDPNSSTHTSKLRIRPPFWYPDGRPVAGTPPPADHTQPDQRNRLFHEEVVGKNGAQQLGFPVEFEYKGLSTKWILGGRIADPTEYDPNSEQRLFTYMVTDLARLVRNYNASLYRLRRLHFCAKYNKASWPRANPDGDPDPNGGDAKDPVSDGHFNGRRDAAETNWCTVTDALNTFLQNAKNNGYTSQSTPGRLMLQGNDMIAVNGYIVSIRVVVRTPPEPGQMRALEITGSSSHVSIRSPFSSS